MKQLAGGPTERVNREVSRDDDGDRIENGAIDIASGVENHFVKVIIGATALGQLAVNVLDHDDGGVGDDNLFAGDRYKWSLRFTVINLTNKVALYNCFSTFSGTHYVTPRTETVELGFHF
jgi:hypothetical protein